MYLTNPLASVPVHPQELIAPDSGIELIDGIGREEGACQAVERTGLPDEGGEQGPVRHEENKRQIEPPQPEQGNVGGTVGEQ